MNSFNFLIPFLLILISFGRYIEAFSTKRTYAETPEYCTLPRDPGPCIKYLPRYHWDPSANECKRFIYGGCSGNSNNFHSESVCQMSCASTQTTVTTTTTNDTDFASSSTETSDMNSSSSILE